MCLHQILTMMSVPLLFMGSDVITGLPLHHELSYRYNEPKNARFFEVPPQHNHQSNHGHIIFRLHKSFSVSFDYIDEIINYNQNSQEVSKLLRNQQKIINESTIDLPKEPENDVKIDSTILSDIFNENQTTDTSLDKTTDEVDVETTTDMLFDNSTLDDDNYRFGGGLAAEHAFITLVG